jgi:hypothetical protein
MKVNDQMMEMKYIQMEKKLNKSEKNWKSKTKENCLKMKKDSDIVLLSHLLSHIYNKQFLFK